MANASLRPNIIWIMADDMGFGDPRCFHPDSRIPTPNMDALASEGMRFTDAHSPSAVCTPTRYGVLTGRHCWRTRLKQGVIGGYESPLIERDRMTVASMLKQCGYATACIGKWHIGLDFHDTSGRIVHEEDKIDFSQPVSGGPVDLGFDYAYFNAGCGTCAPPYGFIENDRFVDDCFSFFNAGDGKGPANVGAFGQWGGMMGASWETKNADLIITDKACDYIEKHATDDSPFFLYLTPNAPHEPCLDRFVPDIARGKSDAGARGDLVWLFDWIVGRVRESLARTGQTDDTLVFVTSDNGALPGDFVLDEQGQRVISDSGQNEYLYRQHDHKPNGEWRGYKAHIWEGGHREPFFAQWPGHIESGSVCDQPMCLTDLFATAAGIVGYDMPTDAGEDSHSILPALLGQPMEDDRTLIHHSSFGAFSIRQGNWKLILHTTGSGGWPTPRDTPPRDDRPGQLYDLANDPAERHNLFDQRGDVVHRLTEELDQIRRTGRSR